MLVRFRSPFIFYKTTKTAGTSSEAALEQMIWGREPTHVKRMTVYRDGFVTKRGALSLERQHELALDIKLRFFCEFGKELTPETKKIIALRNHSTVDDSKLALSETFVRNALKVVNVRNPWDKAVSAYFWKMRGRVPSQGIKGDFEKFASEYVPIGIDEDVCDIFDESWIALRYESLETDLQELSRRCEFTKDFRLQGYKSHTRPAEFKSGEIYSDSAKRSIAKNWSHWIDKFHYEFER